jgi:hypothetical protein
MPSVTIPGTVKARYTPGVRLPRVFMVQLEWDLVVMATSQVCKAPEGFEGLDLSKGSCGEIPSVVQGIPSWDCGKAEGAGVYPMVSFAMYVVITAKGLCLRWGLRIWSKTGSRFKGCLVFQGREVDGRDERVRPH